MAVSKATSKKTAENLNPPNSAISANSVDSSGSANPATGKAAPTTKKANSAFMKPLNIREPLAAIVGDQPLPRTEVVKKVWAYIKEHNLQDKNNKRQINADDKLRAVFDNKDSVNMFEMTKLISKHLS